MDRDAPTPDSAGHSTTRLGRLMRPLQRFWSLRDALRRRPIMVASGIGLLVLTVGLGMLGSLLLLPKSNENFEEQFAKVLQEDERDAPRSKELALWQATASEAFVLDAFIGLEKASQLQAANADPAEIKAALEKSRAQLKLAEEKRLDTAATNFLLGRILEELELENLALKQFIRTRRRHFASDAGFAAAIHEADILMGLQLPDEAVLAFSRVLPEIDSFDRYRNRWLTQSDLRTRIRVILAWLLEAKQHEAAITMANLSKHAFPRAEAVEMRSDAQIAKGEQLDFEADQRPADSKALRSEANITFVAAGHSLELASLRFTTRKYSDYLWKATEAYAEGNDYRSVIRVVRNYLREETQNRRPHALTLLGESQLALGQSDASLRSLNAAIDQYPNHPITYRARLAASRVYLETQQLSKAKELLNDNLHNGVLSPRSNEWRKSLFLLGIVFRSEGLAFDRKGRKEGIDSTSPSRQQAAIPFLVSADRAFENAIRRLGELVLRFEKDNKSLMIAEPVEANQARYMIAESYRFRAKLPRAKLRFELIGTVRTTLENQRKLHLNAANAEYENLISRLNRQQDVSTLGDVDNVILRNCYFLAADTLFHLERNEDAIVAYSSATNRYQHEPASLDAYLQIAACYRRLNQPKKAKGIMEQAKVVLTKMPTDLDYTKTSRFSRQQWEQHLK